MNLKPILIFIFLLPFLNGFCNEIQKPTFKDQDKRQISITELINEMMNCKDSIYILENKAIIYDGKEAEKIMNVKYSAPGEIDTTVDKLVIKPYCVFKHCTFILADKASLSPIIFYNLYFENGLYFKYCNFDNSLSIGNCQFNGLELFHCALRGGLHIERSKILELFRVSQCDFFDWSLNLRETKFIDTTADYDYFRNKKLSTPYLFFFRYTDNIHSIEIRNCKFTADNKSNNIVRIAGIYKQIWFINSKFDTPLDLEGCFIDNSFAVGECIFNYPIGVENFNFPERNTNVHWNMLKGNKLCIYDDYNDGPYLANSDSQIVKLYNFTELISAYKNFFSVYKTRGDMESANGCYVEMKDIETRRLTLLNKQNPTLQSFFKLKLNQFLKIFCDYGTNPAKSLIISLYVVLTFSVFYFFFYSDWDRINRSLLMRKYTKLLQYLRSEQKLEDFYTDAHKQEFQSYEDFKSTIIQSKMEIPFFINLLGSPLYRLSVIRRKLMEWFYRKTEILSSRWIDLKPIGKWYVTSVVTLVIIVYLTYLIGLRSLTAFTLSVNSFSTLGFGDIPVKGFSRYIVILEGFLGWFLLSIFSVSLISQILQN